MDVGQARRQVYVIHTAARHHNPTLQDMKATFYRAVLQAIADGKTKMPGHVAREALKAEQESWL